MRTSLSLVLQWSSLFFAPHKFAVSKFSPNIIAIRSDFTRPAPKIVRQFTLRWLILSLALFTSAANAEISNATKNQSGYNPINTITLSEEPLIYSLNTQAHSVHDPDRLWQPNELVSNINRFKEILQSPSTSISNTGGAYWLVINTKNSTTEDRWKLKFTHSRTDLLDVIVIPHKPEETIVHLKGGLKQNSSDREVYSLGHTFNLNLKPESTYTIAIRAESILFEGKLFVDLMTESTYRQTSRGAELVTLCTLGIMIALTFYNLFIFFGTRDATYLWYSLYGAGLVSTWAGYLGFTWEVTGYADPNRYVMSLSYLGLIFFRLLFTRSFLNLSEYAKKVDMFFSLGLSIIALAVSSIPFVHANTIFMAFWFLTLPVSVLCLSAPIHVYRKGYRPARFLMIGYGLMAVGTITTWLSIANLVPYNISLILLGPPSDSPSPTTFILMSALEMLLLSLALADRINQLGADKRAAEEATKLKSNFLAIMGHEVRTPLNGLLSMVQLLSKTPLNKNQAAFVNNIDYSGNALLSLLDDVLDYSKFEKNNIELESIPFEPELLIDTMVMLMSARASEKGLVFTACIDEKIPQHLNGDPNRLRQILLNLVSNAIKFTSTGSVRVEARLIQSDDDTQDSYQSSQTTNIAIIEFSVIDTGMGIPEDFRESIFDVFTQADTSITRRFGGSGLGLNICQQLVKAMGGRLRVTGREGEGSTFTFTLPFETPSSDITNKPVTKTVDEAPTINPQEQTESEPPPFRIEIPSVASSPNQKEEAVVNKPGLNILLVDDVAINRVAGKGLLECEGHKVTPAANGHQCVAYLKAGNFDVVLMDIHMPEIDGVQTTKRIRQIPDKRLADIPVIALTANASFEAKLEYIHEGLTEVMSKPINVEQFEKLAKKLFPHLRKTHATKPSEETA